ncbi:AraC family transcriptional regulator [Sphingobacterium sp. CZ-2]|uniref:AraC family transcriptional regulator n=1 Tax=Sphingobacterium sp. CZ-2 TaxID=2557994 RepID=UPI0010705848|nr:AraC family transcriptional regulator [Sphingobacterium sp. CZ-2]QBR11753.1 AraC family transcriptional regulator [Sphingobacterium sp. CZ-2]
MESIKNMEVKTPIEFTAPAGGSGSFYVQEDILEQFYSHYHRHKEIQISYIVRGRGSVVIGNLIQPFVKDEIYILKANDPHVFIKENDSIELIHVVHLFVGFEKLRSLFEMSELRSIRDFFKNLDSSKKLSPKHSLEIKEVFLDLFRSQNISKLKKVFTVFDFLFTQESNMISLYSGLQDSNFNDRVGIRINEVLRYTLENYAKDITIDEIAKLIHMTPSAFCKYFKKHTMKTYVTFLNEIRIEKACQLLVNHSTENISEVAYLCGFNTVVHFNRLFKHIIGCSPTDFTYKRSVPLKEVYR